MSVKKDMERGRRWSDLMKLARARGLLELIRCSQCRDRFWRRKKTTAITWCSRFCHGLLKLKLAGDAGPLPRG